MKHMGDSVKDLQVAYVGGGSRGWAWGFMKDLALDGQMEGTVRLYDIDAKAAESNRVIGEKISALPGAKARWKYTVAGDLASALKGADFVVISILPGTFDEMESDVHLPEQYGIYQSVGDTVGPGGLVRALRTIPMYVEIAEAIRANCPGAWVVNYTNPMTLCLRTLYKVFPGIKAFGCCHEVFGTQKLLADMLADMEGIEGVKRQDIATNVVGINHFTWFDKASYRGADLFPLYEKFVDKYYDSGFTAAGDDNWMNNSFRSAQRVKFDLFRRYGLIAAAGDRHLAEFMPPWYLKDPETVKKWMFGLTTVAWRKKDLQERLDKSAALVSGAEPVALDGSGEEGHYLMKALLGLGDMVSNVNVPNAGQTPNLPPDAVVETNALFRRDSVQPVCAGAIPAGVLGLVARHVANQEATIQAALGCDYKLALAAFLNDPLMTAGPEDGEKLFKAMLKNTAKYLPEGWKPYM